MWPTRANAVLVIAAIAFVSWIAFALFWAWKACWQYATIMPNAEYWGQVLTPGFALLGSALMFAALLIQAASLKETQKEVSKAHDIADRQAAQLERLASDSRLDARWSQIMGLIELRNRLLASYHSGAGKTDTNVFAAHLDRLEIVLQAAIKSPDLSEDQRLLLQQIAGKLTNDKRDIVDV